MLSHWSHRTCHTIFFQKIAYSFGKRRAGISYSVPPNLYPSHIPFLGLTNIMYFYSNIHNYGYVFRRAGKPSCAPTGFPGILFKCEHCYWCICIYVCYVVMGQYVHPSLVPKPYNML